MRSLKQVILYGASLWAVLVATSLLLRVYETGDSPLFESLKFVVLAVATVIFAALYIQKVKKSNAVEGFAAGSAWMLIVVGLDLVLYALGLFNLSLDSYLMDVASSYLVMPIITAILAERLRAR